MKGICALYNIETELLESHIYPKFVINYIKKTGSKFLRKLVEPNVRRQDGIKLFLLGEKAEQKFSIREKWFAEKIFIPYISGKLDLDYNENLYYFTVSFLWRILVLEFKRDPDLKNKWYYDIIIEAEAQWKKYLITGELPKTHKRFCIFFTDRIKKNNSDLKGVDFYFTRILDATIIDNEPHTCLLIYGKFSRFIFWVNLVDYGDEDTLTDTEINPTGGKLKIPQRLQYFPLVSFLGNRLRQIENITLPGEEQQRKIEEEILKDPEGFWNSDVGQSLFNDKFNLNHPNWRSM